MEKASTAKTNAIRLNQSKILYFRPSDLSGIELLSCRDVGFDFPAHFHQAYCIWFNTSGGEQYSQRGYTNILQSACFSIVAPGEVHANRTIDHSSRNLMTFYIQPALLQTVSEQLGMTNSNSVEFKSGFYRDSECLDGLSRLFDILRHSTSTLEKESVLLESFRLLTDRHAVTKTCESAIGNEKMRVLGVIDLLHSHLSENISLSELSKSFDCTPYHLIRFFKKEKGLTPYAYLLRLRLERARELICQGRTLVDTALETGFADQSHLNRHFKALYGISPGEFKRQVSHGKSRFNEQ
ncbi:AraC family transcriptional regulator [Geobacter pickeringii]|uniref:AraC family transcriptional regulator n=1 Tax=Geobacter pickeringii TaxID=345632 RepID=UPI0009FF53BD|nr:AraC family transcriptional regulator [Geobacter pickeringii]